MAAPKIRADFFYKFVLKLETGGRFEFDAVSADNTIVANISTSSARTAGHKYAAGPIQKIRADMLFLLMAPVQRRLIVFTQPDMYDWWVEEKEKRKRVPDRVKFEFASLSPDLAKKLAYAKLVASLEVTPGQT